MILIENWKKKMEHNSKKNIPRNKIAKEHKKEEAELKVWMKILSTKDLYSNNGNILHSALRYVKFFGSVINQHGCKETASILPST